MVVEEFHYRLGWRTRAHRIGFHAGTQRGPGSEFRGLAPLVSAGDPRRLDLRSTARDPFGQLLVRIYTQSSSVPVYALADLSASMGFRGSARKVDMLADFVAALGLSAFRTGDPVGFLGCDEEIRADYSRPLAWSRGVGLELAERLRDLEPRGRGCSALLQAAARLPTERSLVFVISDFYVNAELVDELLAQLARHLVVPVVLRDSAELELPAFGFARLRDAEHGKERTLFVRERLRARLREQARIHDELLGRRFAAAGTRAITFTGRFEAERVTRHFYG